MPPTSVLACPLCGVELDRSQACRSSCPRVDKCSVVCCPRCAYTFPSEQSGLAGILHRLFQRKRDR